MITEIRIENFKSIASLTLQPGRVTVLIGENGSGKSNILEAIAFGAGAAGNKLDREFLYSRGIRVTDDEWMRSAFSKKKTICLRFSHSHRATPLDYLIEATHREDTSFRSWVVTMPVDAEEIAEQLASKTAKDVINTVIQQMREVEEQVLPHKALANYEDLRRTLQSQFQKFEHDVPQLIGKDLAGQKKSLLMAPVAQEIYLIDFLIYAPENTVLRVFDPEGAIEPLGSKGEGLFKLLQSFNDEKYKERLAELKELLHTLGWFEDLSLPTPDDAMRDRIRIQDALLPPDKSIFDQRSANEGFLLLLFYFVLFLSWRTPKFFAIDNIDTALNPKLCATLMRQLAALAAKYDKQVIFTTHNPAVLDGLDLNDDEQRLFVVSRNDEGETKVRRVSAPQPRPGERPIKLSEAFLRGLIGGLPKNF